MCSHLFSPLLTSSELFSHLLSWSHLLSARLTSSQLFSAHFQIISLSLWPKTCLQKRISAPKQASPTLSTEKLLHTASFCTEKLVHAAAFTRRSFYTELGELLFTASFYTKQAFTQRYTKQAFTQYDVQLRKIIVLHAQPRRQATLTQPLQCDLPC